MSRLAEARFLAGLAGNLGDFRVTETDAALSYLLDQTAGALRAENTAIAVCVRDPRGADQPATGWRPVWDARTGPDRLAQEAVFRGWYGDPKNHAHDGMVAALVKTAGATRSFLRRDLVDDDVWRRSPVQELFDALAVRDRLVAGIPAGPGTEVIITAYRRSGEPDFSEDDRELAGHMAAAVRLFCRRLTLIQGFGPGLAPLSPRERGVLMALLTGMTEKEIALELGLTPRSLHQYVVAVYRKLGTTSRAQLMARFLSPGE